jgi:predicted transcriptional regulator
MARNIHSLIADILSVVQTQRNNQMSRLITAAAIPVRRFAIIAGCLTIGGAAHASRRRRLRLAARLRRIFTRVNHLMAP